jgi:hypothetical protein
MRAEVPPQKISNARKMQILVEFRRLAAIFEINEIKQC